MTFPRALLLFLVGIQFIHLPSALADLKASGHEPARLKAGSNQNDVLQGGDMSDRIDAKAGDDVLIGGKGIDFLIGGPGADQFIIDFDANEADEILDFNPEEGDVVILRHRLGAASAMPFDNIRVNRKGELQVSLDGTKWRPVAKLHRPNLTFKIQAKGNKATLRFETRF